jgi:hypothetical protein
LIRPLFLLIMYFLISMSDTGFIFPGIFLPWKPAVPERQVFEIHR